jgi:hypothetical protein
MTNERLDEFDKDEFREATRPLWPKGYTEEDFDRAWGEFQEMKRRMKMQ